MKKHIKILFTVCLLMLPFLFTVPDQAINKVIDASASIELYDDSNNYFSYIFGNMSEEKDELQGQQNCGYDSLGKEIFHDHNYNHYDCRNEDCLYGNCTWWAAYKRDDIGDVSWHNAYQWDESAEDDGYAVCSEAKNGEDPCPRLPGAVAWWDFGDKGHVAYVENGNPLELSEMDCYKKEKNYPKNDPQVWVHMDEFGERVLVSDPHGYIYRFRSESVTLFEDVGLVGGGLTFIDNVFDYNISYWFNDKLSSISIEYPWAVLLHEHAYGGGGCLALDEDDYDLTDNKFDNGHPVNDNVSSITVVEGACLFCDRYQDSKNNQVNSEDINSAINNNIASYGVCSYPLPPDNNGAIFTGYESIPDGTIVAPDQSFEKTWRMKNTGTSTWGSGYKLVFQHGDQIGAPTEVDVPSTAPGEVVDLSVNMKAPSQAGWYSGEWQLVDPQGTSFGEKIWVKIQVSSANPGEHITAFDVSPASPSQASSVHVVGRIRSFDDFRSMRFVIGDQVHEMSNFQQVGEQSEISIDWDTASLARGNYAILFEVSKNGDLDWSSAERQVKTYTLTGTPASNNHPPDRPVLSSPYNWYLKDASGLSASVELCVNPVSDPDGDAVKYYFEVKDQGGGVYANSGWVSNRCWSHTYNANTYSWRVKSGDGSDSSDWSTETWNFTVAKGGVYIGDHTIFSPNTNETHVCVYITYDGIQAPEVYAWLNKSPGGSESGEWRLLDHYGPNASPDCTQPNYHGFWIHSPEYQTGTHKLRISAVKKDSGANAKKDTSYTIAYIRPSDVKILTPSTRTNNGTWWDNRTIHFEWSPSLRVDNYTLRVSTNSNPWADSSPILNKTFGSGTTSYDHTFSQDYNKLYWSVRASNSAGSTDSGGNVWFGIDTVKPSCQVEELSDITYENVFQVNWSGTDNASGMQSYEVQYRDSARDEWRDWLGNAPASKPYELFSGQPGHTYAFRCRGTDVAGNIGGYPGEKDTQIKVDPSARPQEPWWNTAYSYKRDITILNNEANVKMELGYPLHLHFDSSTTPTAYELYNASKSSVKCNDFRIISDNTNELHRHIQNCSSSEIDIWFRSQISLNGGKSNSSNHQLYYANSNTSIPLNDPNQIWYPIKEVDTKYLYFFQEGSGLIAHDSSGNNKDCLVNTSIQWANSKFGSGLRFNKANNGDSRSIVCPSAIPLSSFTIEFWYNTENENFLGRIAGELAGNGNGGHNNWVLEDDGRLRFVVWPCIGCGAISVESNLNLRDEQYYNNWNHIAVTYNGGNKVRFYINGSLDSEKTLEHSGIATSNPPLEIGSTEGIHQIKGNLGVFRISSGVKTDFPYGKYGLIKLEPSVAAGQTQTPPEAGSPDLEITNLEAFPNSTGGMLIQAQVKNIGELETMNGFFTDVYVDHIPTGTGDYTGSVKFWINRPIEAGSSITLTTVIEDVNSTFDLTSKLDAPLSETTSNLYAQTDSTGAVTEPDNSNNIFTEGTQVCFASEDAYEDDDSAANAKWLLMNTSQNHNMNKPGDEDWVKFSAKAGTQYTIQTSSLDSQSDTYLYLYDKDKTTILESSDDCNESLSSKINWTAPEDAVYYVMVKHWNNNIGGCGTNYQLSLLLGSRVFLPMMIR
jgi:surface antigen